MKSRKAKSSKKPGSSLQETKSAPELTCFITLEVEPVVDAKLRHLCRAFSLPYPDGIAVILEKTCAIVDKRRRKGKA